MCEHIGCCASGIAGKIRNTTKSDNFRGFESREEIVTICFVKTVVEIARNVSKLFKTNSLIYMTEEEQQNLKCEKCNFCKSKFVEKITRSQIMTIFQVYTVNYSAIPACKTSDD